jgi:hypothetical protein
LSKEDGCTEREQSRIFAALRNGSRKTTVEIARDCDLGASAAKRCLSYMDSLGVVHRGKDKRFSVDDTFLQEFEEELNKKRRAEIGALEREVYLSALKRVEEESEAERRTRQRKQGGVA